MKEKLYAATQKFSRAILQPVMFMAVTGILISVAALLKLEFMPEFIRTTGTYMFNILSSGIIGQLPIIFCVGIATSLAKDKKTDAAIMAVTIFLVFLFANNQWLDLTGKLVPDDGGGLYGTGQNYVLGVQVTDMGVFLGIMLGVISGYVFNKFKHVRFHKSLSTYEGTKFAFLVMVFVTIFLAISVTYIWPPVNNMINALVQFISSSGDFGFFVYGFANRMALPFGLHHLLWMPLYYTPLGGTAVVAGQTYAGAQNIWLAELGNVSTLTAIDSSVGYILNFGYIALPIGIALAFIKTSKPENKNKVKSILIPAVLAAVIAGITEPIEFMFLFISPLLWVVHSVIYGFGLMFSSMLGLRVQVANLIDTIIASLIIPMGLGKQWLIPIIMVIMIAIEYFAFVFIIKKFDIKTLGRGDMLDDVDEESSSGAITGESNYSFDVLLEGLGGLENIKEINNCLSRLRIDVLDDTLVSEEKLKKFEQQGVILRGKHIQVIMGVGVEDVKEAFMQYLKTVI